MRSRSLPSDPPGQVQVLGHDGHSFGVDSTKVGVLKEPNEIGLGGFLEGQDRLALEPDVLLELGGDLPDQPHEGQSPDQQVGLNNQKRGKEGASSRRNAPTAHSPTERGLRSSGTS